MLNFLITADDRTGALEAAGTIADEGFSVTAGSEITDGDCLVVDLRTRHASAASAAQRVRKTHQTTAQARCHKIDSVLRGNWPHEVKALVDMGFAIDVVPSFPDAGRYCRQGVVYVNDVPVAESTSAADPLNPIKSSRPMELLRAAGCSDQDVRVIDANDNSELARAAQGCRAEGRMLVGPSGAIQAYAATFGRPRSQKKFILEPPILIVCGSLHPMSRMQIRRLQCPMYTLDEKFVISNRLCVLTTTEPTKTPDLNTARTIAQTLASRSKSAAQVGTLVVIGGDTAAAVLGNGPVEVLGNLQTAVPVANRDGQMLVTKGGGIGKPDTLLDLLSD